MWQSTCLTPRISLAGQSEVDNPESIDDIAKCHVLLLPDPSGNNKTKYRVLTFGRKHAPASRDEDKHETEWGIISGVGDDIGNLKETFGASTYETKTKGTRHQPASRCAAYGHYILHSPQSGEGVKPADRASESHPRDHPVYLAYGISVPLPEDFGDVQRELDIKKTGSFAIQGTFIYRSSLGRSRLPATSKIAVDYGWLTLLTMLSLRFAK